MRLLPDRVVRAMALCRQAETLCALAAATRARIRAERQRHPLRRLTCLARGASDAPMHTRDYRCPYCGEEDQVLPTGRVTASGGMIYADHRCAVCDRVFVFVRVSVGFQGRPAPRNLPGPAPGDA